MKALVLTYDDRIEFSELVVKSYNILCPNHKFEFIIPYNNIIPSYAVEHTNIKWVKAGLSVKETMAVLLSEIPDEEFVYWCLDDIYPHKILQPNIFNNMYEYIVAGGKCDAFGDRCDALRFINHDTLNGCPILSDYLRLAI